MTTDEEYEELMDMPLTELVDEHISLLKEIKRLTAMYDETNHYLDLMVGAFGIEPLVEMVGEEE